MLGGKIHIHCCIVVCLGILQYILSYINGVATVVIADYGKNIMLFYILGVNGSIMLILLTKLNFIFRKCEWIKVLAMGSILVLGFHMHFVNLFRNIVFKELNIPSDIGCYLASIIILMLFVPIIYVIQKYVPFLIGKKYEF